MTLLYEIDSCLSYRNVNIILFKDPDYRDIAMAAANVLVAHLNKFCGPLDWTFTATRETPGDGDW